MLVAIEQGWSQTNAFYRGQNSELWKKRRNYVVLCIYLPLVIVALVAAGLAAETGRAMLYPTSQQQVSEND